MKENLLLRLKDSSSKECEVTGEEMGGDVFYEIPVSLLKPGLVEWPKNSGSPTHAIVVKEIGDDYLSIEVRDAAGTYHPVTLHEGEYYSDGYCFGEWAYSCRVTLEEAAPSVIASFTPEAALAEAQEKEREGVLCYWDIKDLYKNAARLGSADAYVWLVKEALTVRFSPSGSSHYEALGFLKEAKEKGLGEKVQEAYDARETFYVVDDVLWRVYRGGKKLTVPENVTTIAPYCFSDSYYRINKLIIPPSVTTIRSNAFWRCEQVREVEIQGPAHIERNAFGRCKKLKKITLPKDAIVEGDLLDGYTTGVEVVRN